MDKFSNAKVGDKVFSLKFGWGKIINTSYSNDFPLNVSFATKGYSSYTLDGKSWMQDEYPSLFWNRPVIDDPAPKRKVKKTITKWINLYTDSKRNWTNGYESKEEATELSKKTIGYIKVLVVAQPVVFEYEEKE